jgi:transcriptional regulator with XRE-family HTH domain
MEQGLAFGKCLNGLLIARGWSAARLAKELNLDASYVRRWVRGDRVPSIESNYVEKVTNCLCGGVDASGLKKLKENYIIALKELGEIIDKEKNIDELVKESLSKTQMYSLRLKREERVMKSISTDDNTISLLGKINKNNKKSGNENSAISSLDNIGYTPSLVKGRESIFVHIFLCLKQHGNSAKQKKVK